MKDSFNPDTVFNSAPTASTIVVPSADDAKLNRLKARAAAGKKIPDTYKDLVADVVRSPVAASIKRRNTKSKPIEDVTTPASMKVTFELAGGLYTVPAIAVKECKYGIAVIMPNGLNDTVFSPLPGAELLVHYNGKQVKCFSPGISFDFMEYKFISVVLIRAES